MAPLVRTVWTWLRLAAGIVLVVLGLVGIFLPVVPQLLFLLPGLVLLSTHFRWARRLLDYVRARKEARHPP